MTSLLGFADEPQAQPSANPWRILVVDDDPEVHAVTRLALGDFTFDRRPLEILGAASATEARALWQRESGLALILLDVVMETDRAGLEFVRFVRDEPGGDQVQIVLRTGQPGQAPALELIRQYEINDYLTKTELTFQRLNMVVTTALRTYRLLQEIDERQYAQREANRELERFAYVTSQDLKSPLRTIVDFSRLLDRHYRTALDAEARELLNRMVKGAQDMDVLIGNLLEYARVGRCETAIDKVDLNHVIEATRRSTQFMIEQRGAALECGVLPELEGNAALLEQMFSRLIDNAIKYQPGARPWIAINAVDQGASWEVSVEDHGSGIDPRFQPYVFEPFRSLNLTEQFAGPGIGLAICKRVAEVHDGSIRVESEQGRGTTIVVTLPKVQRRRSGGRRQDSFAGP